MKKRLFYFVVLLSIVSCEHKEGCGGDRVCSSIWDNLDLRAVSGLRADVEEVVCYINDGNSEDDPSTPDVDESQIRSMYQKFNGKGQLIAYNPTPIDVEDLAPMGVVSGRINDGFGQSTASYKYSYDGLGRIVEVEMYDIAIFGLEPVTYSISYGNHGVYIPAPFAVGVLPVYLLKGVVSIESSFGYSMECDGESATEIYPSLGWVSPARRSVHEIIDRYTRSIVFESLMSGDDGGDVVVNRTVEKYFWSDNGLLESVFVKITNPASGGDVSEESTEEVITYSKVDMFKVLNHVWSINGTTDALYYYKYNQQLLPIEGAYRTGESYPNLGYYPPVPFMWKYLKFDSSGNWTEKSQSLLHDDYESVITWKQSLRYFTDN